MDKHQLHRLIRVSLSSEAIGDHLSPYNSPFNYIFSFRSVAIHYIPDWLPGCRRLLKTNLSPTIQSSVYCVGRELLALITHQHGIQSWSCWVLWMGSKLKRQRVCNKEKVEKRRRKTMCFSNYPVTGGNKSLRHLFQAAPQELQVKVPRRPVISLLLMMVQGGPSTSPRQHRVSLCQMKRITVKYASRSHDFLSPQ